MTDVDQTAPLRTPGRRAFMISSLVVALVVAIALGYSVVRDPGPQPPIPPEISGTDNGSLKRAIVHYVGAVASRDPSTIVDLMTPASSEYLATTGEPWATRTVRTFGEAAQGKAQATVEDTEFGGSKSVTITFEDGQVQQVAFTSGGPDDRWSPGPGRSS